MGSMKKQKEEWGRAETQKEWEIVGLGTGKGWKNRMRNGEEERRTGRELTGGRRQC